MTREEHLAWAKERALEYLDPAKGTPDPQLAFQSFGSDMRKHPEIQVPTVLWQIGLAILTSFRTTKVQEMRDWITGFN